MPTNILLIMADQLRADALACNGNPVIETPNLDRLASSGVNCTACYTPAPICVPARAALATGCYPHRCTGTKNDEGAILPGFPLRPADLAAAGYRTYATGKLHYLPYAPPGEPRVTHGFQVTEVAESGRALGTWDPEGRLHDLMPTLLAAAGQPAPEGIDGLDLSAMLRGGGPVRDVLVAQCHDAPRQQYMVRDRRWKYLYHQDGAVEELFDLDADPHELCDLARSASEPAASRRRSLRSALIEWCRRHGDDVMLDGDDLAAADARPHFRRPPPAYSPFGRRYY